MATRGGAARALLLRSLKIDPAYIPRDIDLVRISKKEIYEGADADLAKRYMSEDFEFGTGVEVILNEDEYFSTRDLTINEALATDDRVVTTKQCLVDNVRHILRPSNYEKNRGSSCKMLAKIIRFYVESIHRYDDAAVEEVEGWDFEKSFISPFWLASQLDKAYDVNRMVAIEYFNRLKILKQIPSEIESPEEAAEYLSELLSHSFYYRHAPVEQFRLERQWTDSDEQYEHLPKKMGHGKGKNL